MLKREYDADRDRWYINQESGEKYAGVTSVLNVASKPGIEKAKLKKQAEYLADRRKTMDSLTKQAYLATVKNEDVYLDEWRIARDIGTAAHQVLEDLIAGEEKDAAKYEVDGWEGQNPKLWMTRAWEELNEQFSVLPVQSETLVYSDKYGYAGTYDNAWYIDGELCMVDAKTNKGGPRPNVALQNVAYAMAENALDEKGNPTKNPKFERSRVFWVRPEGWNLYELRFDKDLWVDFRAMLRVYQHTKVREGRAIEEALHDDGLTFFRRF